MDNVKDMTGDKRIYSLLFRRKTKMLFELTNAKTPTYCFWCRIPAKLTGRSFTHLPPDEPVNLAVYLPANEDGIRTVAAENGDLHVTVRAYKNLNIDMWKPVCGGAWDMFVIGNDDEFPDKVKEGIFGLCLQFFADEIELSYDEKLLTT